MLLQAVILFSELRHPNWASGLSVTRVSSSGLDLMFLFLELATSEERMMALRS